MAKVGYDLVWRRKKEGKKKEERDRLELESKKVEFQEDFIPKSSIRESICYSKLELLVS